MKYKYCNNIKDDDVLRESFNELTRMTFGFDFTNWYDRGHWGNKYIPHVLLDHNKVISNVSANIMRFNVNGQIKKYIQLGTVMTHPEYRGKGLNKYLMNKVLESFSSEVDGIYLFGNDSVLDYYPRFGFTTINEYEYYSNLNMKKSDVKYLLEKVDLSDLNQRKLLYDMILNCSQKEWSLNDSMNMYDNLGLYHFWVDMEFSDDIYYLPEIEAYVIACIEQGQLQLIQIIGNRKVDIDKLSLSFDTDIKTIKFGFTPADREQYNFKIHREDDTTLFILGNDLLDIEREKLMFPIISHA